MSGNAIGHLHRQDHPEAKQALMMPSLRLTNEPGA
jgi:hypothetical protein